MGRLISTLLLPRLVQAALVAGLVGSLTFILTRALPGDMAFRIAAGRYGYEQVNAEAAAAVQAELGLDQSPLIAWWHWLFDLLSLDLGHSLVSGEPVINELTHQLGHSLELALMAILLAMVIGVPLGIVCGLRPNGWLDRAALVSAVALRSLPPFVIGLALIMLFAVQLGWLPAAGHGSGSHIWLPAMALALGLAAVSARVTRHGMVRVVGSHWYAFSRTRGLSEGQTLLRHGLRNVAVPVIAYLSVQLVYLVEGVVVIESLFAWPGIGHALVHAVVARDVPMIQGTALIMGLLFVALNALVDLISLYIDPRRRLS